MQTLIAITAAALVSLSAGHAAAQAAAPVTAAVSYADLDLSQASGREALKRRIEAAADRVCVEDASRTGHDAMYNYGLCRDLARAGARRQLAAAHSGPRAADPSIKVAAGNR